MRGPQGQFVFGGQGRTVSTKITPLAVGRRCTVLLDLPADGRVDVRDAAMVSP